MPRDIAAGVETELAASQLSPILLVRMYFESGVVRFWNGPGPFLYGEEGEAWDDGTNFDDGTAWDDTVLVAPTWTGVGSLGTVGTIEETSELRAVGLQLGLSGVPVEAVTEDGRTLTQVFLEQNWQDRPVEVFFGVLDDQGQLIDEPIQIFGGVMDQAAIAEGSVASIMLACESAMIALESTLGWRYTSESHRARFPADAGCDFVTSLQDKEIIWGRPGP